MSAATLQKNAKKQKNALSTPLLLPAPVPSKKRSLPYAAFGTKALPSTQTNGRPQTWMLRGFIGRRPFVRVGGGKAPMAKAIGTSREGLIVGLSFFTANIMVAPTIFPAYREKERSPANYLAVN